MKITKVEALPFGIPIRSFADAYTGFAESNAVLVKLHTDAGVTGLGEACAWEPEFYGETLESVTTTIQNYAAPRIIGQNPMNIGKIMALLDAALADATCAKEGVDIALHDLVGKALNVPVSTILGGRFREKIPIASEIGIDTPEKMAENALDVIGLGIQIIKIKGSNDAALDVQRIKAVRSAVGEDVALRLDPNAAWDVSATIQTMKKIEDCHLQYLEQPVPGWDLKGMAHVRRNIGIPLMADESIWSHQDAVRIFEYGAADILNIKLPKACGLHRAKKIEATAEALGMPCIVGTEIEPGLSWIAKLHLASSMRNHPLASEFTELTLLKDNILDFEIRIVDGCVEVPSGPGLGVGLREDVFQKYRKQLP
jgi:L-alanine-DL-glutamate epimerase-like enolase superfamily enzyme